MLLLLLLACRREPGDEPPPEDTASTGTTPTCAAEETVCDGLDDDCNGVVDEHLLRAFYADVDGDTYGDPAVVTTACTAPTGYVPDATDCDDADPTVSPGGTEICDGLDQDCDGAVDEGVMSAFWTDADGDGFGDPDAPVEACEVAAGRVLDATDCDDADATISPSGVEICDGVDQDCDGAVDEGVTLPFWADVDGDGFGDVDAAIEACEAPAGFVEDATDCDDVDPFASPSGTETCDGVDQDCDGDTDEGVTSVYYSDTDADGYGDATVTTEACTAPAGFVGDATDCDDTDAHTSPAGMETCDGADQDCDGLVDEAVTSVFYADADADGYGDATVPTEACAAPVGYTTNAADCDDADAAVSPAGVEVCDARDQDCDGVVDDGVQSTYYADVDGDGFGDAAATTDACAAPAGHVATATDCDDGDATVSPVGVETCASAADDDCDGDTNERNTVDCDTWYLDEDGDGHGSTTNRCYCAASGLFSATLDDDCDDALPDVYPGTDERWDDDIDNDCEGSTDIVPLATAGFGLVGEATNDRAGFAAALLGDMDGDGNGDLIVSASANDHAGASSGSAYIVLGPVDAGESLTTRADGRWWGESSSDYAGCGVAGVGDVDGDGLPDALVGAYGSDSSAPMAGAAYLLTGVGDGDDSLAGATATILGSSYAEWLGHGVGAAGDVDADGYADVLVRSNVRTDTYLFLGPLSGQYTSADADTTLDITDDVGGADLDGDGVQDLYGNCGTTGYGVVCAMYGPIPAGTLGLADADVRIDGVSYNQRFGWSVTAVEDADGDGDVDLFVGSYGNNSAAGYLFAGPLAAASHSTDAVATFEGPGTSSSTFSESVADVGDDDGDGLHELLVGDPTGTWDILFGGAAYLYTGPYVGTLQVGDAAVTLTGGGSIDDAGDVVRGGEDLTGDGIIDLLVSESGYGTSSQGAVWVVPRP